jgi:hypothetical protein
MHLEFTESYQVPLIAGNTDDEGTYVNIFSLALPLHATIWHSIFSLSEGLLSLTYAVLFLL